MIDATASLKAVSFQAGGFRFAVEASQVRFMRTALPDDDDKPVAYEAAALIGMPPGDAPRRWLAMDCAGKLVYVAVCEPVKLEPLPVAHVFPLPAMLLARTALRGLRALALDGQTPVLLVDLRAAMTSELASQPVVQNR